MGLSEKDIKKLWGLAAGRCSFPNCNIDCLIFIDDNDPTVIGEMAHVIAKKAKGPRGVPEGGNDTYENTILLCPTHHTLIDKAPEGAFPKEMLLEWKSNHEKLVRDSLKVRKYPSSIEMAKAIKRLLIENHRIWYEFGPESESAKKNPLSNLYKTWELRKLATIVLNNKKIIGIMRNHEEFFEIEDYEVCCEFMEHAIVFEQSCYSRIEGAKRFPLKFSEVINKYVKTK